MRCVFSSDCDLIKAVADIIARNAIELLVNLNQTYLFFVKLGLEKVKKDPQQAVALVVSVQVGV